MRIAIFFAYTSDARRAMISQPGDRLAAIRGLVEGAGGSVESLDFMFGDWDGFVTIEAPDTETAAALALAVSSTGSFSRLETRHLLTPDQFVAALRAAGSLSYAKPGS
jgi:uncharacterized protein with GYD domain